MTTKRAPRPTHSFDELRNSFTTSKAFLDNESSLSAVTLQSLYDALCTKYCLVKFDIRKYPSLSTELSILGASQTLWDHVPGLPQVWSPDHVRAAILKRGNDPLIRLLVAYIWKQGDFPKVARLLGGVRAQPTDEPDDDRTVMFQFGRHLADQLNEPIFDQHTSRARLLLSQLNQWHTPAEFMKLFGRAAPIPTGDAALTSAAMRNAYITWWRQTLKARLPAELTNSDERASTILWADRLMFSLGATAKRVFTALTKGSSN